MSAPKVALVRATPATVLDDYARLLDLAGITAALGAGRPLRLLPQHSRHYPFPGANTPPWQLDGALRALARAGHTRLCVDLPRPGLAGGLLGDDLAGLRPVAQSCGAALCDGAAGPGEALLWLTTLSGAAAPPAAALERALAAGRGGPPVAAVLDATTVDCGGQPLVRNALLASADPLALLALAAGRPVALVGDTELADQMRCPQGTRAQAGPRWLHHYRWSARDRRRFESWLRDTGWGRLFAAYQLGQAPEEQRR